jgi:hypothetical protein
MKDKSIRWVQRFSNYKKALRELEEAVALAKERSMSWLEAQGLIHCFESTYELGCNTLADFLQNQGNQKLYGFRDAMVLSQNFDQ